jgi:hypothetical protein
METVQIIQAVIGAYLITISFITLTENVASSIIFKVIPFFSGLALLGIVTNLIK